MAGKGGGSQPSGDLDEGEVLRGLYDDMLGERPRGEADTIGLFGARSDAIAGLDISRRSKLGSVG